MNNDKHLILLGMQAAMKTCPDRFIINTRIFIPLIVKDPEYKKKND